jgi:hypothetical protein
MGHSRHYDHAPITSGLPPSTDIGDASRHVSKVPLTDMGRSSCHFVGECPRCIPMKAHLRCIQAPIF